MSSSRDIGPEEAKIQAHFAAVADDLRALGHMKVCDRCGAETILNALCDDCGAIQHRPDCINTGWGHAAYCLCTRESGDQP